MGKERFLKELGPSPEVADTSGTQAEKTKSEGHRDESTNTDEATEPMDDAKLKARIKAEAEAEAERQKVEAEKPTGMRWPLSILNK